MSLGIRKVVRMLLSMGHPTVEPPARTEIMWLMFRRERLRGIPLWSRLVLSAMKVPPHQWMYQWAARLTKIFP